MAKVKKKISEADPKPQRPTSAQQLLEKHTKVKDLIEKAAKHASVLFADMVGSTAFKEDHEAADALEKPYNHHLVICKIVEDKQHGGQVIKSLGDGVMVMFDGEECERRAITAGLAVLEAFRRGNNARKAKGADAAILTRIGIHSGPVWTLKFPESKVEDPQGTTVDVAARLCALAEAEQLLCTEQETFKVAGGEEMFKNAGKAGRRFLKGVPDRLSVRMVLPEADGWKPTHVPISGYRHPIRSALKKQLDDACALFLKGGKSLEKAYEAFTKIVEDDPNSFEAHFALSSMMLSSDPDNLEIIEECEALRQHLVVATQGNPKYYKVWMLVGLARLRRFEYHGRNTTDLDLAFEHTEAALILAMQDLDVPGILECKMQLAKLLIVRARLAGSDEGAADLAKAARHCMDVEPTLNGHMDYKNLEYIETNGRIRIAQATKREDLDEVERQFNDLFEKDRQNPMILRALADLFVKRDSLPETGTD